MTSIKELHYFTGLEAPKSLERQLEVMTRRIAKLQAQLAGAGELNRVWIGRQLGDLQRWLVVLRQGEAGVADYVAFLRDGAKPTQLVGEVTPAYAMLPVARYQQMAGLGSHVRFVYLMRDPVDRLWSHIRMVAERAVEPGMDLAAKAREVFDRYLAGGEEGIARRCDYAGALGRMRRALQPEMLFTAFYEQFFTEAALRKLCKFLRIGFVPGEFDMRVHAGTELVLSEDYRRAAQRVLAPQYDYVSDMFGALPARWQDNYMKV